MRLEAQAKAGYYPCPAEAVDLAMSMVNRPRVPVALLDPCAGCGLALAQLAAGMPLSRTWAIELEEGRSDQTRANLPGGNILAPASCLGCVASARSFSAIWCNSPFDDIIGGGERVELQFLQRVTPWLMTGGIMFFVLPENILQVVRPYWLQWYGYGVCLPFPEPRKYREVLLCGVKRANPRQSKGLDWRVEVSREPRKFDLPPSDGPKRWEKVEFTETELAHALARSPLNRHLAPARDSRLARPPLPLGPGHIALLLASGMLDGVVAPPDGLAHVVRGTATKVKFVSDTQQKESSSGEVMTTTVYSERIALSVRAAYADGTIKTYE